MEAATLSELTRKPGDGAVHPVRPAEIVELSELVYQGIFGAGLVVAVMMCSLAVGLSAVQPDGSRRSGGAASLALLIFCLAIYGKRRTAYRFLRRHPAAIYLPAVAVGAGSWAAGTENQQLFYVVTLVLGVTGMAVPLRYLCGAVTIAAVGVALPKLTGSSPGVPSTAIAAVTVPTIFWLIIDRLARYMLRANELTFGAAPEPQPPPTSAPRRRRRWAQRGLRASARRKLLAAANEEPATPAERLTARQLQVVLLCAEGLNHLEIAACLGIGPQQVRRHLRQAREVTRSRTSSELVVWALRAGLIPDEFLESA